MLNTFERTQMQHERRLAIQQQMERMEQAATGRNLAAILGDEASDEASNSAEERRVAAASSEVDTITLGLPSGYIGDRRSLYLATQAASRSSLRSFGSKDSKDSDKDNPKKEKRESFGGARSIWQALKGTIGSERQEQKEGVGTSLWASLTAPPATPEQKRNIAPAWNRSMIGMETDLEPTPYGDEDEHRDKEHRRRFGMVFRTMMASFIDYLGSRECRKRLLIVLAAVAIAIGLGFGISRGGGASSVPSSSPNVGSDNHHGDIARPGSLTPADIERYDTIRSRILGDFISTHADLKKIGTPQYQALVWIATTDPMQLEPDDEFLLQRYALAVFYYATHGEHMFDLAPENTDRGPSKTKGDSRDDAKPTDEGALDDDEARVGGDTHNPYWTNETNWLSGTGYCLWHGVRCHHRHGRPENEVQFDDNWGVTALNLTRNGVKGSIPPEVMTALVEMRILDLGQNGMGGPIPEQIRFMDQLEGLYLENNAFSGTIPTELCGLPSLEQLFINTNQFRGIIPSEVGDLKFLEGMGLYQNYFMGKIPETIAKLQNLRVLYLDDNGLTGTIPSSFGFLNAVDIRLKGNSLVGSIPSELGNLKNLKVLFLNDNALTGEIPSSLSKIDRLRELHLYKNRLSSTIPSELALLKSLEVLYLDTNDLSGTIPTHLGGLTKLRVLYVHSNKFLEGSIPTEVGSLTELYNLRMHGNGLTGTIPTQLGKLSNLEYLFLDENRLKGQFPSEMGGLTRLAKLRAHHNDLTGIVPEKICLLTLDKLVEFYSDCSGQPPEVECSCCTECKG